MSSSVAPGTTPSPSTSRCSGPRSAPRHRPPPPPRTAAPAPSRTCGVDEALQPQPHPLALRPVEELAVQHLHQRAQRVGARAQPRHRRALPGDAAGCGSQAKPASGVGLQPADPPRHFLAQRPPRRPQHQPPLLALAHRVGHEAEARRHGRPGGPPPPPRRAASPPTAAPRPRPPPAGASDGRRGDRRSGWSAARAARPTAGPRPRARGPASAARPRTQSARAAM